MMGRRHMARLCAFAGWACLAVAVAIAVLTLPFADANATSDDEQASAQRRDIVNDERLCDFSRSVSFK
jgi:hypothetical protein